MEEHRPRVAPPRRSPSFCAELRQTLVFIVVYIGLGSLSRWALISSGAG